MFRAVVLRDISDDDLPIFFEHQREPEANHMAAFPPRDRQAFMNHWRTKVLTDPIGKRKTIVADGQVAGNVVSWQQDDQLRLGYWIGRSYWGRGIATAAVTEFLENCEKRRPIYAYVATHNVGSIRVLDKCGFQRVGDPIVGLDGVTELLMQLA